MKPIIRTSIATALFAASFTLATTAQVTLNFDAAVRGPKISPLQYGIFYEEINNAGDGGLYAELIRNRNFEDSSNPDHWSKIGTPTLTIVREGLMNDNRKAALDLKLTGADQGISNTGYWGIKCTGGDVFNLTVWLKSDAGYKGIVTGMIVDPNGLEGAMGSKEVTLDGKWQKISISMSAPDAASYIGNGKFNLIFSNSGSLTVGMVSLFPKTYKDRENGCRIDLAQKLADLHPKFVRFPGGCYIEGDGTVTDNRRFEWEKTIGPIEERPGHYNYNWGYPSTDGLGFHEFLQLTEDLGAEPLFVANIGIGHGWVKDYTDIDEYIQEALDAIEYCNGDINTYWGKKRAENGHPEPFNLNLIEIGNENYQQDDERSDHYAERYKAFYDAIKAKWPEVTLIGNVEAWGTDDPSWRNENPVEIVDEHYYRTPKWFEQKYNKYDSYDRKGPKVYAGEYAVTGGYGTNGHLRAALGEAVYMQGMENNSDICIMASYAPIFYNEERNGGWLPDMIRFNNETSFGTPSYYVQKMMPQYLGKQNLKWTESSNRASTSENKVGVSSWSTTVTYDNVKVTDRNGNLLFSDDFSGDLSEWNLPSSNWSITGGALAQHSSGEQGQIAFAKTVLPDNYTFELDAVKNSGAEGFLIAVNVADRNNYIWWNLGGWNNTQHGMQFCSDGAKSDYDLKPGSIESGRTYHIKVDVDGARVRCYLDGNLMHDVTFPVERKVYVSSTIDDENGLMYLKLVNTTDKDTEVNINMTNADISSAETVVLTSASATDENTMANPDKIIPHTGISPLIEEGGAVYTAPANSLSIITMQLSDINYNPVAVKKATEEQVATLKEELSSITHKLNWLHSNTSLPLMTTSGTILTWSEASDAKGINVFNSRHSSTLEIDVPNTSDKIMDAGHIIALAEFADGATDEIRIPVRLAEADDWHGYLYTYMNPDKEVTNMALGTKESLGKKFEQLLDGEEIYNTADLAGIEGGNRDAYLSRGERNQEYLMAATDMCNAKSGVWNNYGIDLFRSNDLVHWESTVFDFRKGKSIFSDSEAVTDSYKTDAEYAKIYRVWAPQFVWDETAFNGEGAYLVYYSILSTNSGDNYDRIYYSYADKDFKTLTQPRLFFDAGVSVIDADIVYNNYDNLWHMLLKYTGSETGIFEFTSEKLLGGEWQKIGRIESQNTTGVEAPTVVRRIGEDIQNFYFMRYDSEYAYKVADMSHDGGMSGLAVKVAGNGRFQHGSIIYVDKDEYDMLSVYSDVKSLLRQAKNIKSDSSTAVFDGAIEFAEKVIAENRSVAALLDKLPEAYDKLVEAYGKYLAEGDSEEDGFRDITFMLQNPSFDGDSKEGWSGTPFTAVSYNTAEQYSRIFDNYQILEDMPAGCYRFQVQAFYRYGLPASAQPAHINGTEHLLAKLYINDAETSIMSLYDETYSNYPNNMSQASTAFNTDKNYTDNVVNIVLEEQGAIKLGIRKKTMVDGDWTIFDNFRLTYNPDISAVEEIKSGAEAIVDVYSADGILLKSNVAFDKATNGLPAGIYIVGKQKVVVK